MRRSVRILSIVTFLALLTITGAAWAQPLCTDDFIVHVEGSLVTITHKGAFYNCCPEFEYDVMLEEDLMVVHEVETHQGCFCVCCIDLSVEIEDVPPGEYVLEFHWYDYEAAEWLVWIDTVIVPDVGQGSVVPYVFQHDRSGCYTSVPGEEEHSSTWGAIKTLYR